MNTKIKVYTALCDVSLASIVAWSELTTSSADKFDGTNESVKDLFASKHPVSNRLLILADGYFSEYRMIDGIVDHIRSVRAEYADYRII